ncbi:hypothetical protein T484DRAFT_1829037 [Baffinella frigidus]|nr:hypothetical protein T484DRAFT_1829037 [Cryptophyta sp. CCMP2293]
MAGPEPSSLGADTAGPDTHCCRPLLTLDTPGGGALLPGGKDDSMRAAMRVGLPLVFRTAFAAMLNILWVDVSPQMAIIVPSLTRPFSRAMEPKALDLASGLHPGEDTRAASGEGDNSLMASRDVDFQCCPPRIDKLFLVEQVLEDYFEKQMGKQNPFDPPATQLTLANLSALQVMVKFGLYQKKAKVMGLVDSLVILLDGSQDEVQIPADSAAVPTSVLSDKPGIINRCFHPQPSTDTVRP